MSLKSPLIFYIFASAWLAIPVASLSADTELRIQPERIEQRIMELSAFGKNPEGGVSRVAFSQADLDGRAHSNPH